MYPSLRIIFPAVLAISCLSQSAAQTLDGEWILVEEESTDIDPWRAWNIRIALDDDAVTLDRVWQAGRYAQRDSLTVPPGAPHDIPIRPGKWMDQVYLGVFVPGNATRSVTAVVSDSGRHLSITSIVPLQSSQVDIHVTIVSDYNLTEDGAGMILTERRSSRVTEQPLRYVFKKIDE